MLTKLHPASLLEVTPLVFRDRTNKFLPAPRPKMAQEPSPAPTERMEEFNARLEKSAREAYETGVRDGVAQVKAETEQQLREVAQRLADSIAEITNMRGDAIREAEADVVKLSLAIAHRILHREVSIDSSALEALVRSALEKLRSQEVHRVRIHPDHEQLIRSCLAQTGRHPGIEVVPDPSLLRGGIIFDLSRGSMDASVETQLAEIERGFADQIGART